MAISCGRVIGPDAAIKSQCGDYCEVCGDCVVCYEEDPCLDGGPHTPPVKTADENGDHQGLEG